MDLISCNNCGVILDKDKLKFPIDVWDKFMDCVDLNKAVWNGNEYVPFVKCPVCKGVIYQND